MVELRARDPGRRAYVLDRRVGDALPEDQAGRRVDYALTGLLALARQRANGGASRGHSADSTSGMDHAIHSLLEWNTRSISLGLRQPLEGSTRHMALQGKTALITGGTSGMGSATALAMAEKGASVIVTGRDDTRGASTVEKIRAGGHDAQFIAADFSEMSEVRRVADAAGEIDVLVNCAGFAALAPTADTDEAAFDGLFQINVKAPFFLVAALAPKIAARGGGSIINVSTMVASYGQPGMAAYGASRAAIELLTKAWAAEYGPQNVRVNAVAPGPTLTPAVEPRLEMAKEFAKTIPLRRVAEVHELSDVITFLATPAAGYINGAIIPVDGGRLAI